MPEKHSTAADLYDEFGSGTDNPNAEATFSPESIGPGVRSTGDQAAAGLAAMVGHRLRDQCEYCDAEGEVVPDAENARLFHLRIYHADSCPVLRAHSNRRQRREQRRRN